MRFNGFYLFQVTAWCTKLAASTMRTAIPPPEGPRSMAAGSDSEGTGERVRQHVRQRLLCLLAYNRSVLRRDFSSEPEELAQSIDHFTPAPEWLDERYAEALISSVRRLHHGCSRTDHVLQRGCCRTVGAASKVGKRPLVWFLAHLLARWLLAPA